MANQPLTEVKVRYGRRKLDAEAYSAQKKAKAERVDGREGTRYGKRKIATEPLPKGKQGSTRTMTAPPSDPPREPTGTLPSIAKLKELLAAKPAQLDAAIEVELKQEKPRKGALILFHEIENDKEEPRADVLDKIDAALASFEE